MSWAIWTVGSILVAVAFESGTLAFYVAAGLVFIVGSTIRRGHPSTARADVSGTKR